MSFGSRDPGIPGSESHLSLPGLFRLAGIQIVSCGESAINNVRRFRDRSTAITRAPVSLSLCSCLPLQFSLSAVFSASLLSLSVSRAFRVREFEETRLNCEFYSSAAATNEIGYLGGFSDSAPYKFSDKRNFSRLGV